MYDTAQDAVPMPNVPEMDVMWTVTENLLVDVVLGMCNNEEVKDCYVFGNRMIMIKFEVFYFILDD